EASTKTSKPLLDRRRPVRISADGLGDTAGSPDRDSDPGGCRGRDRLRAAAVAAGLQGEALPGEAREQQDRGVRPPIEEEEEGLNDHNVVVKCAEIQSAISEGEKLGIFRYLVLVLPKAGRKPETRGVVVPSKKEMVLKPAFASAS
ncbi:hypothetical protein GW17_00037468, partial [Ensete ventricosum]